jgi:hypothetical protein
MGKGQGEVEEEVVEEEVVEEVAWTNVVLALSSATNAMDTAASSKMYRRREGGSWGEAGTTT